MNNLYWMLFYHLLILCLWIIIIRLCILYISNWTAFQLNGSCWLTDEFVKDNLTNDQSVGENYSSVWYSPTSQFSAKLSEVLLVEIIRPIVRCRTAKFDDVRTSKISIFLPVSAWTVLYHHSCWQHQWALSRQIK